MPKTKEEILADIAKAVEGQGNQGAIAIAPILKDIVELAGEGGGGGGGAVIPVDINLAEASGTTTFTPEQLTQVKEDIKSSAKGPFFKIMQPTAEAPLNTVEFYIPAYLVSQPVGDAIVCDSPMKYGGTTYKGVGIDVSTAEVRLLPTD